MSDLAASSITRRPRLAAIGSSVAAAIAGLALMIGWGVIASKLLPKTSNPLGGAARLATFQVVLVALTLAAVRTVLVRWRRYAPGDIGLAFDRRTLAQVGAGFAGGALMVLVTCAIVWGVGGYRVTLAPANEHPAIGALLITFVAACAGAAFEELLFRVALVGPLQTVLSPVIAVGVPAAIFGVAHATNAHASWVSVANTTLAGVLFGLLLLDPSGRPRAPSLGWCTGVHAGWNFVLGDLLSIPVSGHARSSRWLDVRAVDTLWSGGAYGLEAGLATTAVLAAVIAWLAARIRHARLS